MGRQKADHRPHSQAIDGLWAQSDSRPFNWPSLALISFAPRFLFNHSF
jgi:hypothetical protein